VGGLVIAAGSGFRAPSAVGAGLAVAGLVPLAASAVLRRRRRREFAEFEADAATPDVGAAAS
jgi:DHA1 family inner membrane transport protein